MIRVDQPPLLDFCIAGVQKAGTTALARYLMQHEELYIPPAKEYHLFKKWPAADAGVASARAVAHHYADAPADRLLGEATPIYTYWPDCLALMHEHNPQMKLIISLRHPVARAFSGWSMEMRRGREDQPFSWCIRDGRQRVAKAPGGVHLTYSYVERGLYAGQIRRLLDVFPRQQVFFLRADQIQAAHPALQALLAFLAVSPLKFTPIRDNVFPSSLPATSADLAEDALYLQDLYADDMGQLAALSGLDVDDWLAGPPPLGDGAQPHHGW